MNIDQLVLPEHLKIFEQFPISFFSIEDNELIFSLNEFCAVFSITIDSTLHSIQ